MISRKSSTLALVAWCLLGSAAAHAEETVPTSGQPAVAPAVSPTAAETITAPSLSTSTPTTVTTPEVAPSATSTSSAPPAVASDPMALLYAEKVAPGPFEAKRQLLLSSIKVAKKQNFGVTVYLGELNKVEDQIKQGNASPQLEARIDSIADGLTDQLKRSQILKTQRPTGSSTSRTSYAGGSADSSSRPHKNTDAMINELRQKYGDKIPAGMDNGELKEKLMKSDLAKEYLKKFTGQ